MIFKYKCDKCNNIFEANVSPIDVVIKCPACNSKATRIFEATRNFHIPSYFHTNKSDIFSYEEWQELKKDPNVERAK